MRSLSDTITAAVGIVGIVSAYAIYAFNNPGTDGVLFGTVMVVIGALAGVKVRDAVQGRGINGR